MKLLASAVLAACAVLPFASPSHAANIRTYTLGGAFDDVPISITVCGSISALKKLDGALGEKNYGTMIGALARINSSGECWYTDPMKRVAVYDVMASEDLSETDFYQRLNYVQYQCGKSPCYGILLQGPFGGWADAANEIIAVRTGSGIIEYLSQ